MARLLCKIAIIGFIAVNSPLLAGKPEKAEATAVVETIAATVPSKALGGSSNLTAAREAAQILAGLDPETRERVLGAAASLAARPVHR